MRAKSSIRAAIRRWKPKSPCPGQIGRAAVPSGASTGSREAIELRDGDKTRYLGKGVRKAVANVNGTIAAAILGRDAADQRGLDDTLIALDGTENKAKLGANALLGGIDGERACGGGRQGQAAVASSRRRARAGAAGADDEHHQRRRACRQQCRHAGIHGAAGRLGSFSDALRCGTEIFHALKSVLKGRGLATAVGDEGGFAPDLRSNEEAIETILEAIAKAGYKAGEDVLLASTWPRRNSTRMVATTCPAKAPLLTREQIVEFYARSGARSTRS
jgi:enolase